mgnify:CR=1 FL=1
MGVTPERGRAASTGRGASGSGAGAATATAMGTASESISNVLPSATATETPAARTTLHGSRASPAA